MATVPSLSCWCGHPVVVAVIFDVRGWGWIGGDHGAIVIVVIVNVRGCGWSGGDQGTVVVIVYNVGEIECIWVMLLLSEHHLPMICLPDICIEDSSTIAL